MNEPDTHEQAFAENCCPHCGRYLGLFREVCPDCGRHRDPGRDDDEPREEYATEEDQD